MDFQSIFAPTDDKITSASLYLDYLKHALLAICMGEDSGHYAGCAVHSYQTCIRLECACADLLGMQLMDASTWAMLSGVRTEDGQPGGFLHMTEPSSCHCLTHQWIASGDGASCWFHSRRNMCWVSVIDPVRINSSTAHTRSLTPQRSMLTNLKVTAYVQTPTWHELHDTLAEKHITKILKCFTISAAPYIYVTISKPQISEQKHIQTAHLWIYITAETGSSYFLPKNMNVCTLLNNKKFMSLTPESSYITLHCTCTLVLHDHMYVHMPVTVQTPRQWAFKGWNMGVVIITTWNFPQTLCFCWLIYRKKKTMYM